MDVAMLYHGNHEELHPAHRGFAESIGADLQSVSEASPHSAKSVYQELARGYSIGHYDVIIAEGSRPLYTGLVHKAIYDSRLVYLCADHRLYELWNGTTKIKSIYTLFKYLLGEYGKPIAKRIVRYGVDGVIAVSKLSEEYLRPITGDQIPVRIAHPYVQLDLYNQLREIRPALGRKTAMTVGRSTQYKGVDMLVESWPEVRSRHPDAELHIVGQGHPTSFEEYSGVSVDGYVEDLSSVYTSVSLYIQPSRIDPFPVTVLEALCAGLPAIVTEKTGSRSAVTKLDERLITSTTPEALSESINWFFGLDKEQKKSLSENAKILGQKFSPEASKRMFRDEYQKLLRDF